MKRPQTGSMILEAAITMPLFVIIVFVIIQMSFVWVAKEVTHYAAYCGARAALVYNPADYAPSRDYGVVKQAAMTPLSWISWSLNAPGDWGNFKIGWTDVPLSSYVRTQTHVEVEEYKVIGETNRQNAANFPIEAQFPAVTVTVGFDCPVFIPLGGPIVAYFFGAKKAGVSTEGAVGMNGFMAPNGGIVDAALMPYCPDPAMLNWFHYSIRLTERCTLAKPWKTVTFPVMSDEDRLNVLGINYGAHW